MQMAGWDFRVQPAVVDERPLNGESAETYVSRLAVEKARACAAQLSEDEIIIAADTAVVDGEEILGKPAHPGEAKAMLEKLRGHSHRVCTGVAVTRHAQGTLLSDLCVTVVPMRLYSDTEIQDYVNSSDPLDKAGAYAIQHEGFHPVEFFTGCYASVMGLPLCHLARTLKKLGVGVQKDIASGCKSELHYDCPISSAVLLGENIG
jgi:septum formation protein